jgi:hypothetical protein
MIPAAEPGIQGVALTADFPDPTGAFETDLIVYSLWQQFKPVLPF